jgi:alpha-tubulin suppressor-like RCC1 family protein
VAAGGLYTAALADDGELYVWGQAMAGTPGELHCLATRGDDEDEYVKTVELGEGARVVDVGVGNAHVLVAVEAGESRAVWAAGDNQYGALGLGPEMEGREFVEEFTAVEALNGKRVKQMVCAGMSSFVVVEAESTDEIKE